LGFTAAWRSKLGSGKRGKGRREGGGKGSSHLYSVHNFPSTYPLWARGPPPKSGGKGEKKREGGVPLFILFFRHGVTPLLLRSADKKKKGGERERRRQFSSFWPCLAEEERRREKEEKGEKGVSFTLFNNIRRLPSGFREGGGGKVFYLVYLFENISGSPGMRSPSRSGRGREEKKKREASSFHLLPIVFGMFSRRMGKGKRGEKKGKFPPIYRGGKKKEKRGGRGGGEGADSEFHGFLLDPARFWIKRRGKGGGRRLPSSVFRVLLSSHFFRAVVKRGKRELPPPSPISSCKRSPPFLS